MTTPAFDLMPCIISRLALLSLVSLLAGAGEALGATYYVATTGNDSTGTGSISNPWRNIEKGLNTMASGDTLNVRAGTYNSDGSQLNGFKTGISAAQPTIIQAYPGESVTYLDTTDRLNMVSIAGKSNIWISGITFDGQSQSASNIKIDSGSQRITITNCVIKNTHDGHGILISNTGSGAELGLHTIVNSQFLTNGWAALISDSDLHQIYVQNSSNLISGCYFRGVTNILGDGFGIHDFSTDSFHNTYRNNYITNCYTGIGLVGARNHDNQVFNNIITRSHQYGIRTQFSSNSFLLNNTLFTNGLNLQILTSTNMVVENNIAVGGSIANPGGIYVNACNGATVRNNLSYDSYVSGVRTFDYRVNASSGVVASGNLFTYPSPGPIGTQYNAAFINQTAGNLAIKTSGNAYGTALTQTAFSTDYFGNTRSGAWDIGAIEYAGVVPSFYCDQAWVQAAINGSSSGDTVSVPAGSCDWTTTVNIDKSITVKGAGIGQTIISNRITTSSWYQGAALFYVTSGGTPRISGFTLDGNWTTYNPSGGVGIVCAGNGNTRVDNCFIKNCYLWGVYAAPNSNTQGLIDHCVFENNCLDHSFMGDNHAAWLRPLGIGTTNCWVSEDNFSARTRNDRWIPIMGDGLYGSRYVLRFNTLSNYTYTGFDQIMDAHGNTGGGNEPYGPFSVRGVVFFESYNNLWSSITLNRVSQLRGGTQIHYNNRTFASGGTVNAFNVLYQLTEEDGFYNSNPVLTAWPGVDGITNSYFFNNTLNGGVSLATPAGVFLQWPGVTPCPVRNCPTCLCPPSTAASDNIFIEQNRDWFAAMPSTNFYLPLVYPHPRVTADNDPPIAPLFTLASPANGASSVSIQPTLTWNDVSGETGYQIQVSTNIFFSTAFIDQTLAANTVAYQVPGGLLSNNQTYYWRVWSRSVNGRNRATDPFRTFSTGASPSVPGSVQFASATYEINEDESPMVVSVQRVGGSDGAASVNYSTSDGTAVNGVNYTAVSGTLNWANGETAAKTISIPILIDGLLSDKTMAVTLSGPLTVTLGSPSTTQVTIKNVDVPPPPPLMPGLTAHAYEGQIRSPALTNASGWFYQQVEDSNPATSGRVAWRFTIPETRQYRVLGTVNGTAPDRNSFVIDFDDDTPTVPYSTWGFSITGSGLEPRYVSWIGNGTALSQFPTNIWSLTAGVHTLYVWGLEANAFLDEVTIEPVPIPGQLQLFSSVYSANEDVTPLTITVRRVNGEDGAVSVNYATANGTAVSGVNYTATSGTLNWADGDTADKTFNVTIIDDGLYGPDKTFTVNLSSPGGGAAVGDPVSATVTVINTNPPPPPDVPGVIVMVAASQSVYENAGSASILLRRSEGSDGAVGVTYQTQAITAVAGVNYTTTSGTASWADGVTTDFPVSVPILDDGVHGPDLTFKLIINTPTGGASIGTPSTNVVTILNTNPPIIPPVPQQVRWQSAGEQADEGGTIRFTVVRLSGSDGTVSVNYSTRNGTALAGVHYTSMAGTITFGHGDIEAFIDVPLSDNQTYGVNKTFTIRLTNPINCTIVPQASECLGVIQENDPVPGVVINIKAGTYRNVLIGRPQ